MDQTILHSASEKDQKNFFFVFFIASLILAAKLIVSYIAYGTNDIIYTIHFADVIERYGSFKIYSIVSIYNHPPLVSFLLKLIRYISVNTGLGFPYVYRLMAISADYGSIFVVWKLLEKTTAIRRVLICLLVGINPINFLVSSFHGNTDPVFIFLVLLVIYALETKRFTAAGIFYGFSMCIKIVPVILAPVFFFYLSGRREKKRFFIPALAIPIITFAPYIFYDFQSVFRNIFMHGGLNGIWGFGRILKEIFINENLYSGIRSLAFWLFRFHVIFGKLLLFITIAALAKFFIGIKRRNLREGVFMVFCLFLFITPGFGVQYLSWLSFFAILIMPTLGYIYSLIGGFFLYRVYSYWGGTIPPFFYADSDRMGQWVGFDKTLDMILWCIIIVMSVNFLRITLRKKPSRA